MGLDRCKTLYELESFAGVLAGFAGVGAGVVVGDELLPSPVDVFEPPSTGAAGAVVSEPEPSDPDVSGEADSPAGAMLDPPERLSVL